MTIIQFIILYVISDTRFSSQHFIPPLQNCIAAEMCNHTWVPICGFDKTNERIRSFPDECDMIEYNCDYKTDYTQTDQEKCRNNTDNLNDKTNVSATPTTPGRRSNVESVLTNPDYVTPTAPYSEEKDSDDDSYLENVFTNTDRARLPAKILKVNRLVSIKTILSPGNFTSLTTKPFTDRNETHSDFNSKVTTMIWPSLTITDIELAEESRTTKRTFTDSLRHGPQCTCGQHTTELLTTPVTEVVITVTESATVSPEKECTRNKLKTTPTTIISTTEMVPTSQVRTTTELSTEVNTTQVMTTLSNVTYTPIPASNTMSSTTNTSVLITTDQIKNETTTEHASHSFDADGKCNCGKYSSSIITTTILTTTTAEPTTISEATTMTTTPIYETGGECTCYMNTTPAMTTSSIITTGETTTSSTTTPMVSTISPMPATATSNVETTTGSEVTTTTSSPASKTGGECTCYMNTTPAMITSSITTEEIATSTTTAPAVSTTSPMPTTIITTIETTTIAPKSKCTCNVQTNPVTTTPITTEVSNTTTTVTTTTLPTTTIPTTTTTTSRMFTTTESITTPVKNIRECTCGQRPTEATTTSEFTTITELSTTKTEVTTTVKPKTTAKLATTADPTTTTEQVTEPVRECTCYMDTTAVTTPSTTIASMTTPESSTKETTTEDINNNEADSTTTKTTTKSSKVTCSAYPIECKRPSTWETTSKGETRDFFRILKERYGNRVSMLRATTHWPLRIPKIKRFRDLFKYGRHNEG